MENFVVYFIIAIVACGIFNFFTKITQGILRLALSAIIFFVILNWQNIYELLINFLSK